MTEFNSDIVFLEHQSNYPHKGDLYRNGNNFFKAIEAVYQPEIIQLNTDINTSLDQEIEKHADVYTAHKAALANKP